MSNSIRGENDELKTFLEFLICMLQKFYLCSEAHAELQSNYYVQLCNFNHSSHL